MEVSVSHRRQPAWQRARDRVDWKQPPYTPLHVHKQRSPRGWKWWWWRGVHTSRWRLNILAKEQQRWLFRWRRAALFTSPQNTCLHPKGNSNKNEVRDRTNKLPLPRPLTFRVQFRERHRLSVLSPRLFGEPLQTRFNFHK